MYDRLVTVFGGSGFLGRYIVKRLADDGWLVRVAVRRPHEALFLKPLGIVGQIQLVAANVRVKESVEAAVRDADAVVNAVGILAPRGRQRFDTVHVEGARHVAEAAARAGTGALVHVSALGADPDSPSAYARSKAEGEQAVRTAYPQAVILRPSVIFGAEDDFFNRFAALAHRLPFMPVIAGDTRFQPVFVGDVADAVGEIFRRRFSHLCDPAPLYELGGPHVESFRAILRKVLSFTGLERPLVDIPLPLARLLAAVAQFLPGKPFTPDQLTLLARDNVTSGDHPGLSALDITPTPEEAVMPAYMVHFRPEGQFSRGVGGWVSGAVRRARA
ncbi:MAG: complex I NDUFA9 subunit family protein [Alphaproteobacteria bacterium]|nr:MAG: complex I NDUFA9 subunit family protein [Alphaproteobacteria bacterium]